MIRLMPNIVVTFYISNNRKYLQIEVMSQQPEIKKARFKHIIYQFLRHWQKRMFHVLIIWRKYYIIERIEHSRIAFVVSRKISHNLKGWIIAISCYHMVFL